MIRRLMLLVVAALLVLPASADSKFAYPKAKKVDQKDVYHGVEVADPYRWLETDVRESKDVQEWVDAENKVTFAYLEKLPYRAAIKDRLTKLWNYQRQTIPFKAGGRYYFQKNDGLQNQAVLYVQDSLVHEPRVLIDPNTWSKDGTVALNGYSFSDDGRYMAYGVAEAGSDWVTWKVMDIDSGKTLSDELKWVKFSDTSWSKDSEGFFYSRYPTPDATAQFQSLNKDQKLYYHRVGAPQSDDVLVYERPDQPDWSISGQVTDDGRYLLVYLNTGTDPRNQLLYKDLRDPYSAPVTLIGNLDNEYTFAGNKGPVFYVKTDVDAPRRRIVAIDTRHPERANWKEIIPQRDDVLTGINYVGGLFVAEYLKDARSEVKVYTPEGKFVRDVELGTIGTAGGFGGHSTDNEIFYSFASFTVPPSIYRYDVGTGEKKLIFRPNVDFNPDQFEVKQVFYNSKDGTRVPMFIAYKKGLKLDGSNPTLLYGYGGFSISTTPGFSVSRVVWMEMGGVVALPNLRGGCGVRRGVAQGGDEAAEAECLRRFHRRGRVADREQVHESEEAGDPGRQQRRPARRRGDDATPRALRCRAAGGRRHGHAAFPQVHGRTFLDRRLRLGRQRRRVQGALRLFAVPQHPQGHALSGHAGDDCRSRRSRCPRPQFQIRGCVAGSAQRH